jgi:hypothetical protein
MPGRPTGRGAAGPPSRAAGGRGGMPVAGAPPAGGAPGPGRPGRCIPWVDENGLLPGRTCRPVGRPPAGGRGPGAAGAGRGPGRRSGVAEAAGACSDGGVCGAGGVWGVWLGASNGSGAATTGAVGSGARTGADGASTGAGVGSGRGAGAGAAFGAGSFLGAASPAWVRSVSPNDSFSRRTTGASIVDEADLTNSPMSLRVARMTLLSTPNSLASSWTRTLATVLLLGGPNPLGAADR